MGVYLKKAELKDTYFESERWTAEWQKPFDEYERIAGNKLSKSLSKNMPKVNDGSLAASLIETPMQVLPSMQPGKFTSQTIKNAWLGEIANIIWKTKILPNANTQASFFDKEQMALYRALKYGAQPRYNFFVSTERYTGSDWSLPYIKNVKLEPGKFSVEDSDYVFLDIYYTKLQLQRLIKEQSKGESGWNLEALKQLADMAMTSKEMEDKNINERDKQVSSSGIKTTACFNRGVEAPFYMFSKHLPTGTILREWKNPDPTGDLPITMQYCYETLESPYGIGRVELAGPTQNVLDYMTQAHVLATQVGIQPPKKVRGITTDTNLGSIVNAPDALWMLGQAEVDVVQPTSSVYSQFPATFGLYKTQLQTLQGRTDGSVSSESGNPNFSKTPAGVKMQEARTNSQDNYLRNKADTAAAKMAEKMMNVHMANMEGADLLDIAEDDAQKLMAAGYFDENPLTEVPSTNEIPILYEEIRDTFKFEFEPRPEADEDEKNRWLELIDIATSNPELIPRLNQAGWDFDLGEAMKKVISASGADGWDKVLIKIDPEKLQQEIDPATGLPVEPQVDENGVPMDTMGDPNDPNGVIPLEQGPDEVQETMNMYQVDEQIATQIVRARSMGVKEETIATFLQEGGNK